MSKQLVTVLHEDGAVSPEHDPGISESDLLLLYRTMMLNRLVDERMVTLQRQGRIGFYIGSLGEEAAIIGSAYALRPSDWIVPCYREAGAAFLRGFPLRSFVAQLFGNSEDSIKGRQMPNHYAPRELNYLSISSPVGTQIPHAVGVAWAMKIRKKPDAVLVYFGDGATSQGDFHVSMNFAAVFQAPCIFFCRNNQWAISTPRAQQTASESIAIKALAYGMEGVCVDGNDLLAVISTTRAAVDKARRGGGPTLIEAITYRQGAHSTSDDPRVYRKDQEVAQWKKKDPIVRFRAYLEKRGLWNERKNDALEKEIRQEIAELLHHAEKCGPPPIESAFEDVFTDIPPHLKEQLEEARKNRENR